MATQAEYDAATAALLALAHQIIQEKNIPAVFVPASDLQSYAQRAAKVAVDAAVAAVV
jgi:hypothetical protein